MSSRSDAHLDDILEAIRRIETYVAGETRDSFFGTPVLQDAVARNTAHASRVESSRSRRRR